MKKKIILALTACLFAAGSIINVHLAQNDHNLDVSLADISVMAQAETEDPDPTKRYIEFMNSTNGSCFSCYYDPWGSLEQICPATYYEHFCIEDPNGSLNCTERTELFCFSGGCYLTGREC